MARSKTLLSLLGLYAFGIMTTALGQIQGLPASNNLGAEDIWLNPNFTGGTGNGGDTASSEW